MNTETLLLAAAIVAASLAAMWIYHRLCIVPLVEQTNRKKRREELLLFLFRNRNIDILKMDTQQIIDAARKLDDYIEGRDTATPHYYQSLVRSTTEYRRGIHPRQKERRYHEPKDSRSGEDQDETGAQ